MLATLHAVSGWTAEQMTNDLRDLLTGETDIANLSCLTGDLAYAWGAGTEGNRIASIAATVAAGWEFVSEMASSDTGYPSDRSDTDKLVCVRSPIDDAVDIGRYKYLTFGINVNGDFVYAVGMALADDGISPIDIKEQDSTWIYASSTLRLAIGSEFDVSLKVTRAGVGLYAYTDSTSTYEGPVQIIERTQEHDGDADPEIMPVVMVDATTGVSGVSRYEAWNASGPTIQNSVGLYVNQLTISSYLYSGTCIRKDIDGNVSTVLAGVLFGGGEAFYGRQHQDHGIYCIGITGRPNSMVGQRVTIDGSEFEIWGADGFTDGFNSRTFYVEVA